MNNLKNKKILLIICGGIAAYKSLEIIRLLKKKSVNIKRVSDKALLFNQAGMRVQFTNA